MKRFLVEVALFAALQGVVGIGWLAYWRRHDNSYLGASADKERLLATAPGARIVFVGGSNLAFGLDSEMVERRLGRHPVNMGVHGYFGLPFMLREAKVALRSGDVVVLTPEYEHFIFEDWGRGKGLLLKSWALTAWLSPQALRHAPVEVVEEMFLTRKGIQAILDGYHMVGDKKIDPIYGRHNFNRYGDLVLPEALADRVFSYPPGVVPVTYPPNLAVMESMVGHLRVFVAWCRAHDVQVLWASPPWLREKYLANARTIEELEAVVARKVPVEIVLRGREANLPTSRFFDTEYHLNRSGRRERTEFLCERLARALRREKAQAPPASTGGGLPVTLSGRGMQ